MNKITATILAFNEERHIGACLDSLREVADEIIVVDSGSTDRTVEICREYGCKLSTRKFDGFGAQRQYATSLATHQYILSIDADELLSPALQESIKVLKKSGFGHRVYSISRLNFYCGIPVRHCGWYPDRQIRLFDKRYANWNLRDVSETVIFRDSVRPEFIDGDILHHRCDSAEQYRLVAISHAAMKAKVLAASDGEIGVLSPFIHGLKALWRNYVVEGGVFEGKVGRDISFQAYRSEILAYTTARKLKSLRENKEE
ncbi:MAG: glycosyltransferase family 2 protein [Staphylococcus sp.]|nr:glycosyltransferase family 2 protein [Staphylococcus sp.]